MYSIVKVIYGTYVPQNGKVRSDIQTLLDQYYAADQMEWFDQKPFSSGYHGNTEFEPCWVGVQLDEFDEAGDALNISDLKTQPNLEQFSEAMKKLSALPKSVLDILPQIGVYFIFCSS